MTNTSTIVIEETRGQMFNLVLKAKEELESFRLSNQLDVGTNTTELNFHDRCTNPLHDALKEIRVIASKMHTLDELISIVPWWTRIFHTRHKTATNTEYALFRFIQIGVYAIALDPDSPPLKFTPEDCQDYMTLRYKKDGFTEKDIRLIKRIESLDRITVLSRWVEGYSVHQSLVPYLEDMDPIRVKGNADIPIFKIPLAFMWSKQHQLRARAQANSQTVEIPDFERGLCLPDHSCCNQHGMFEKEVRQIVFNSSSDQRDLFQMENLMNRLKVDYEAQKTK